MGRNAGVGVVIRILLGDGVVVGSHGREKVVEM